MEFPYMVFKVGTAFEWDGEHFDYLVVADEDEFKAAIKDGWSAEKPTADAPAKRGRKPKTDAADALEADEE